MTMLAELDAGALPREAATTTPRFAEVLARVLGRPVGGPSAAEPGAKAP
jgi:hypothetical protein